MANRFIAFADWLRGGFRFRVQAPVTATVNRLLTLPDVDGTLVATTAPTNRVSPNLVPTIDLIQRGAIPTNSLVWVGFGGVIQRGGTLPTQQRQVVLQGRVDTALPNGPANALSIGAGLTVILNATPSFVVACAAGHDGQGPVNLIARFASNQTITVLSNATNYIYVDITAAGSISFGVSLVRPLYLRVAPTAPAIDQHWYSLAESRMFRWTGTLWAGVTRTFIGEAVAGATTVTTVRTYAYNGYSESDWFPVVGNTAYLFDHNLGVPIEQLKVSLYSKAASGEINFLVDSNTNPRFVWDQRFGTVYQPWHTMRLQTLTSAVMSAGSPFPSGFLKIIARRVWEV